jgi:hypothetical protein
MGDRARQTMFLGIFTTVFRVLYGAKELRRYSSIDWENGIVARGPGVQFDQ